MDIDQIIEAEDARIWEEINDVDEDLENAIYNLDAGSEHLGQAVDFLTEAADAIRNSNPDAYRIDDLRQAVEDLMNEVDKLRKTMEG